MVRSWASILVAVVVALGCSPRMGTVTTRQTSMATFTRGGISLTVTGTLNVDFGAWWDGNMWCLPGTVIGPWLPVSETQERDGGSGTVDLRYMHCGHVNPRGNETSSRVDHRYPYGHTLGMLSIDTRTMALGDVVAIARSADTDGVSDRTPGQWPYGNFHTQLVQEYLVVHCVAQAPGADSFRPPVCASPQFRMQLSTNFLEADQDFEDAVTALPTDLDSTDPLFPDVNDLLDAFSAYDGELLTGWGTQYLTPMHNHIGYGTTQAAMTGLAMMVMCSDITSSTKIELARRLVQRGISYGGAWLDGRLIDDGHGYGRKCLIILAGNLLGLPYFENIDANVGGGTTPMFPESNGLNFWWSITGHTSFAWWFDPTWTAGWRSVQYSQHATWPDTQETPPPFSRTLINHPISFQDQATGYQLPFAPVNWPRTSWVVSNDRLQRFFLNGYYADHHKALMGIVLAMELMDLTDEHGTALKQSMIQYRAGAPTAADNQLRNEGVVVQWSQGHSLAGGWDLQEWDAHGPQ